MTDSQSWFQQHSEYLKTEAWKDKRRAVLLRDGHVCQAQLDGCTRRAEQVHHLSYQHWKNEPLFELVSVCAWCHNSITNDDRADRTNAAVDERYPKPDQAQHERQMLLRELDRLGKPNQLNDEQLSLYQDLHRRLRLLTELAEQPEQPEQPAATAPEITPGVTA